MICQLDFIYGPDASKDRILSAMINDMDGQNKNISVQNHNTSASYDQVPHVDLETFPQRELHDCNEAASSHCVSDNREKILEESSSICDGFDSKSTTQAMPLQSDKKSPSALEEDSNKDDTGQDLLPLRINVHAVALRRDVSVTNDAGQAASSINGQQLVFARDGSSKKMQIVAPGPLPSEQMPSLSEDEHQKKNEADHILHLLSDRQVAVAPVYAPNFSFDGKEIGSSPRDGSGKIQTTCTSLSLAAKPGLSCLQNELSMKDTGQILLSLSEKCVVKDESDKSNTIDAVWASLPSKPGKDIVIAPEYGPEKRETYSCESLSLPNIKQAAALSNIQLRTNAADQTFFRSPSEKYDAVTQGTVGTKQKEGGKTALEQDKWTHNCKSTKDKREDNIQPFLGKFQRGLVKLYYCAENCLHHFW